MFKKESTADSKTISTLRKKTSFCHVLHWGGKKETLFKSRQPLEFAAARTSGLVDPVLSCQTVFFFSNASNRLLTKLASAASAGKFQAMTKLMITSESAVPSALLLGLYPSNMLRMLNKDLTRSRRVFPSVPKPSKRRKCSAGRVNNNRARAGGRAGGPRAPPLFEN